MSGQSEIPDPKIAAVFAQYDDVQRGALQRLRALIFDTAAKTAEIGALSETLKWGQPSYTPAKPRIGSSVRLGAAGDANVALYFICHTHVVERFGELYPDTFTYDGNRAIILDPRDRWPETELKHCIAIALTWHIARKKIAL